MALVVTQQPVTIPSLYKRWYAGRADLCPCFSLDLPPDILESLAHVAHAVIDVRQNWGDEFAPCGAALGERYRKGGLQAHCRIRWRWPDQLPGEARDLHAIVQRAWLHLPKLLPNKFALDDLVAVYDQRGLDGMRVCVCIPITKAIQKDEWVAKGLLRVDLVRLLGFDGFGQKVMHPAGEPITRLGSGCTVGPLGVVALARLKDRKSMAAEPVGYEVQARPQVIKDFADINGPPNVGNGRGLADPARIVRIAFEFRVGREEVFLGFLEEGTNVRIQGVETTLCALEPENRIIQGRISHWRNETLCILGRV